jgi:hypothetical protein
VRQADYMKSHAAILAIVAFIRRGRQSFPDAFERRS